MLLRRVSGLIYTQRLERRGVSEQLLDSLVHGLDQSCIVNVCMYLIASRQPQAFDPQHFNILLCSQTNSKVIASMKRSTIRPTRFFKITGGWDGVKAKRYHFFQLGDHTFRLQAFDLV